MSALTVSRSESIKGLKVQLAKLEGLRISLNNEVVRVQEALSSNKKQISILRSKINSLEESSKEVNISDHAIVRYCERVLNIDIEKIKEEMLSEINPIIETIGKTANIPTKKGYTVVLKDNSITTILTT